MAIYRNVRLTFWTDNKVEDDYTPEDKYFYLYLLTNPQTNICGCYEVSYSQMERQTGYNKDTIMRLFERFENIHKIIKFNKETKEILILNWHKYNWSKSEKLYAGIEKVAKYVKTKEFQDYIYVELEKLKNDTISIPYTYPMYTSDIYNNINNIKDNNINIIKNIINYLNNKCNTRYRYNTTATKKHINARLADGYTEEDFYTVIDKKAGEWMGTAHERYLRPDTLFGSKFESYLNQHIVGDKIARSAQDRISEVDNW